VATTVIDNTYFDTKVFYETDLDSGPFNNVTNGPTTVYSINVLNGVTSATINYLKLYDTAEEITANSTQPDFVIRVPAVDSLITFGSRGLTVVNGLTIRMVTGEAVSSVDDPGANAICEVTYT
tara:strand:- start:1156 stop:1524 length:369 start_codon:yes stop_codon:yes gene_type:complete